MSQQRIQRIRILVVVLCVFAGACGSNSEVDSQATVDGVAEAPESTESNNPASATIGPISEQNVGQARLTFDTAKATWEARGPFAYTFRSGLESINMIEITFDADGNAGPETVLSGDANPEGWAMVRSVDEAFDKIEASLVSFESSEFEVPSPNDCGNHFNADFDTELGSPTYFDTLGPCDDGVGIQMEVIPEGEEADGPVPSAVPCAEDDYYDTWLSPRAAGTEPLDPDDGVGNEGGIGVVALTLTDGESQLQNGDTIEIIGEWFCIDGKIIAISNDGEERPIATINNDGTLAFRELTLTRSEQ